VRIDYVDDGWEWETLGDEVLGGGRAGFDMWDIV